MADIAQAIANYDALVGVALGAGLTYGFGALNRRHVEKREEATRLYEVRFQAYAQLSQAALTRGVIDPRTSPNAEERLSQAMSSATSAMGAIGLVGSDEVLIAASKLVIAVGEEVERREPDLCRLRDIQAAFRDAARKDLGLSLRLICNGSTTEFVPGSAYMRC
jgi:hypothetical protein